MRIGVGAAAYIKHNTHFVMAMETLESIKSERPLDICLWLNIAVPDEWANQLKNYAHLHTNNENSVSRGWNRAINCLLDRGADYVFVPNLDIVVKPGSLDALVDAAEVNHEPVLWTMANWHYRWDDGVNPGIANAPLHDHWLPYPHFSAFMVDKRLFELVGPFDEAIKPAYNEDLDMHWRIRCAGLRAEQYEGARFYHYGSQTIRNDPELNAQNNVTHGMNNVYFIQKWGFKPATADDPFTDGMYKFPWNDETKVGSEKEYMKTWQEG